MLKSIKFAMILALVLLVSSSSFAQFETLWERSAANENMPSWTSTGSVERGFAYGVVDGNERVYVASRTNGVFIYIIDATDGSDVGMLDMTGVEGGVFPLSDVEVSDDGVIFACNLTTNGANSAFKVYKWTSESVAPVTVIEETAYDGRYGDKFTVTGSVADNTVKVLAASGSSGDMVVFSTADNAASFTSEEITLENISGVSTPSVDIAEGVGYVYNGNGVTPTLFDFDGNLVSSVSSAVVPTGSNAIRYFEAYNGTGFIATYRYGTGFQNAAVVEVGDFTTEAALYGLTTPLGTNANSSGIGDVAVKDNGNGQFTIFVYGTNNGLGAYLTNDGILPVELTSFSANVNENNVSLSWKTATETNNKGFAVERKSENASYNQIAFVDGAINSIEAINYSFTDANLEAGKYTYRLKQVDLDGSVNYSDEVEVSVALPTVFELSQNYPNPFNPSTSISFSIPENSNVKLSVYNLLGEEIATLMNDYKEAGSYNVSFDAANLNSGLYLYRLDAGNFSSTKKMMLVK